LNHDSDQSADHINQTPIVKIKTKLGRPFKKKKPETDSVDEFSNFSNKMMFKSDSKKHLIDTAHKSGRFGPRGPYTKRKNKDSKTSEEHGKSSEAEISID